MSDIKALGLAIKNKEQIDRNTNKLNLIFAKPGINKFMGVYEKVVILSDGTYRTDDYGMSAIIEITPGQTYHFRKDSGNRRRLAFMKEKPIPTEEPKPCDYYIAEVTPGVGYTAPDDAHYLIYYVSNEAIDPPLLQITEGKDYPYFVGYDFIPIYNINSINELRNAILYGNFPILQLDYINKTITVPDGRRVSYQGKRTFINNTGVPLNMTRNFTGLFFNYETSTVGVFDITTESIPKNCILLALINPYTPEVYGVDIRNCEVNGEPYYISDKMKSKINELIQQKIDNINTSKYYFIDDIQGIYDKPSDIEDVSVGQPLDLTTSPYTVITDIYDDLVNRYPNYVSKTLLGEEPTGLPIYQYNFTPPNMDNQSSYLYKKPKILISSAIHGYEQGSAWCLAQFFKDLCDNYQEKPVLEFMRWNVNFIIVPVVNPWGFNNNSRVNSNGVDLNRNFPANWSLGDPDSEYYGGPSPASEIETQLLMNVIDANTDAEWYIDYHNTAGGCPLFYLHDSKAATIAYNVFKTLSRKWAKDYPQAPQDGTLMGYIKTGVNATSVKYAIEEHKMKAFVLETPWKMPFGEVKYDRITIETGTETVGNVFVTILKALK